MQNATAAPANKQQAPPPAPFRVGAQNVVTTDGYTVSQALGTTAVSLANLQSID
jgi:hypothetical protein